MGRPSKPANLILLERKDHRTKAEIKSRQNAEAELITGKHMKAWPEVKANSTAKREFSRLKNLLKTIGKDDALNEGVINRYALLRAECQEFEEKRESFYRSKAEMEKEYRSGPIGRKPDEEDDGRLSPSQYYKLLANMQKNIIALDKQVMAKRNMLLAIEKENIMTIASAMRSIPKKPREKEKTSGVGAFMKKRAEGG